MDAPINFKELAKLRENRKSNKNTKNIQKPKPMTKRKMTMRELIEIEKPYKINIDEIGELSKLCQQKCIQVSETKHNDIWQCENCTFLNIHLSSKCQMCQNINYPKNSIHSLISKNTIKSSLLLGENYVVSSYQENIINNEKIIGKYYVQSQELPQNINILDSLQLITKQNLNTQDFIILIYFQKSLKAYMLNPILKFWFSKMQPILNQNKSGNILLERNITIFEKNKMQESNSIEISLFCYPIRIRFAK